MLNNNRLPEMFPCIAELIKPGAGFETLLRVIVRRQDIPAAKNRTEAFIQETLARHRSARGAYELWTADRRLMRIESRRTADGGSLCLYTDITAHRHVEHALIESESRFEDMVANVPGVVYQLELTAQGATRFHYVSPNVASLLTLEPAAVMADPASWFDLIHRDDRTEFDAAFARSADTLEPWNWEGRIVLPSGDSWWCRGAARPRRLEDGGTLWNGIILDVTERKELEEQLLQAQRLKVVGQLTGGIAHDFNNLMLAIQLHLESLGGNPGLGEAGIQHLEQAQKGLSSAGELTKRLLAFSGRQALDRQTSDINELLTAVIKLLRRTIPENIEIEAELGKGVWHAQVDPHQLENSLINLALNARDAMPTGGVLIVATSNVKQDGRVAGVPEDVETGEYVRIVVTDTGSGMTSDLLDHAIEPYFTTKEFGEGSGLGLSTVYGFVKQSHGHMRLESEPDKGTTVTLYLPRGQAKPTARGVVRTSAPKAVTPEHETILVVEDEPSVRAVVTGILKKYGYRVVEAGDGAEALDRFEEAGPIDLLFTDIVLPGDMNGIDVAARIVQRQPDISVLYISGYAGSVLDEDGYIENGEALLSKPYTTNDLVTRIRELLNDGND